MSVLEIANQRRDKTIKLVRGAITQLQNAQNEICDVEADGSADLYSDIADAYTELQSLAAKIESLKVTGLFQ